LKREHLNASGVKNRGQISHFLPQRCKTITEEMGKMSVNKLRSIYGRTSGIHLMGNRCAAAENKVSVKKTLDTRREGVRHTSGG